MMTGLAGAAMWLMMGLMLLGLAVGAMTWTRRRLHRSHGHQPPPPEQTPQDIPQRRDAAGQTGRDEHLRRQQDRNDP